MVRSSIYVSCLAALLLLGACGGNEETTFASNGGITVTGMMPAAVPGPIPTPVTITGTDFRNIIGDGTPPIPVPEVLVTFIATAPAIPFLGGTSDRVTVRGVITSAGTITTTSPPAVICGPMSVTARVRVTMPSGVVGESAAAIATFMAPTITGIMAAGGGTAFPAATPTGYTLTGTAFTPVGGTVMVHWQTPAGAAPLFGAPVVGPPAFPANPQVGSSGDVTTFGVIASPTTITGLSPPAVVCEGGVTLRPATIDRVELPDGSCTPAGTAVAVDFRAPTIASITNTQPGSPHNGTNDFAAAVPETFTVAGADFGPPGGTAQVTFTATVGTPFANGTSAQAIVTADVLGPTTIRGTSPPGAVCAPALASVALTVGVTLDGGSCTPTPAPADLLAPTVTSITNVTRGGAPVPPFNALFYGHIPETFRLTGTDFGPVGGTALVSFTDTSLAAPAFNPPTPFAGGTSDTVTVVGTITSRTTIEGVTPLAVIAPVPIAPGPPGFGIAATMAADVTALLEGGSCPPAPLAQADLFSSHSVNGLLPGPAPVAVPSTVLLGAAQAEGFTLDGFGFGLSGQVVQVIFEEASGTVLPPPFDGGNASVTVNGTVVNETTITGRLPTITAPRLAESFNARVQVVTVNGSRAYRDQDARFVAPPTITNVVNLRPPFSQAAPLAPQPLTWLACVAQQTRVEGNGFAAGLVERLYRTANGPASLVGAGVLTADPGPAATPRTLTDNVFPTADTLVGWSPVDLTLAADTAMTVRVLNPDQQFHEVSGATMAVTGVLSNLNASAQAGTEAETVICVNPTNPLNASVCAHDGGSGFTQMLHTYTLDAGLTWTPQPIGPPGSASPDGDPAAAFRFDPMIACDAFGNTYVVYGSNDGVQTTIFAHQTPDGGVTWSNVFALPFPASLLLDRWTAAVGPDGGILGNQALYVSLVDGATGDILVAGASIPGLGAAPAALYPSVVVNDLPVGPGNFYQQAACSVGPNGELYVSFIEGDAVMPYPANADTLIWMDVDVDGLASPIATFGFDNLVGATSWTAVRQAGVLPPAQQERGYAVVPFHTVIRSGPNAGRVVITYTAVDELALGLGGVTDLNVVTRYSDTGALIWSPAALVHPPSANDQFHSMIASDPVRGDVYVTWYDTRNDPGNVATQRFSSVSASGATWSPPLLLSQASSTAVPGGGNDYLEYNGVDVRDGCVWAAWADNSDLALPASFPPILPNPDGAGPGDGFDVYVSVYMQRRP